MGKNFQIKKLITFPWSGVELGFFFGGNPAPPKGGGNWTPQIFKNSPNPEKGFLKGAQYRKGGPGFFSRWLVWDGTWALGWINGDVGFQVVTRVKKGEKGGKNLELGWRNFSQN